MFPKSKKNFANKKKFSRGKVFKRKHNERRDAVLKQDDLSDAEEKKSEQESEDAKRVMKERKQNYKRFLIEQGKSAPTKWETFSDDDDEGEEEEEVPSPPSTEEKSSPKKGKKRKLQESEKQIPEKEPKTGDSGDKMQKIKAKLKAKYDNDKWEVKEGSQGEQETTPGKSSQRCLGCRKFGHLLKDCKEFAKKSGDICLKCGSSEHKYRSCPVQKGPKFAFATCFKCKEMGHISKQCPKSSTGIYPNGGSCNHCQGVDHLAKDCKKNRRRGNRHNAKDSKKYFRVNKRKN